MKRNTSEKATVMTFIENIKTTTADRKHCDVKCLFVDLYKDLQLILKREQNKIRGLMYQWLRPFFKKICFNV